MIGNKYGHLTVIDFVGESILGNGNRKSKMWLCRCDCDNKEIVPQSLLNGHRIFSCESCKEKREAKRKRSIEYMDRGNIMGFKKYFEQNEAAFLLIFGRGYSDGIAEEEWLKMFPKN